MADFVLQLRMPQDPRDCRIAGMPADGFGGDRATALELAGRRCGRPCEGLDAGSDDQLGPRARTVLGLAPRATSAHVNKRVGAPLTSRALVVPRWQHERADGIADDGPGLCINQTVDPDSAIKWFSDMQVAPLMRTVRLGQDGPSVDAVLEVLRHAGELTRICCYRRPQELRFLFANRTHAHVLRGAGQHGYMLITNIAIGERLLRFWQVLELAADGEPFSRCTARELAIRAQPRDDADRAVGRVLPRLVEAPYAFGENGLQRVDPGLANQDQGLGKNRPVSLENQAAHLIYRGP